MDDILDRFRLGSLDYSYWGAAGGHRVLGPSNDEGPEVVILGCMTVDGAAEGNLQYTPAGFEATHFDSLIAAEDKHFWFRARNRIIAAAVRRTVRNFPSDYNVLEV